MSAIPTNIPKNALTKALIRPTTIFPINFFTTIFGSSIYFYPINDLSPMLFHFWKH
ncbi:hypothetical protein BGP_1592 [Beggiatoa sp. PS]|nr:hypothetical protein BGP_1592 [Beggiatoa sp. PS]